MSESICLNPTCGRPYTQKTGWQKFCCEACRREAWLLRRFIPRKDMIEKVEDLYRQVETLLKELKKERFDKKP